VTPDPQHLANAARMSLQDLAAAPDLALMGRGVDHLALIILGCRLPPAAVQRHLDPAAWAALARLAEMAAARALGDLTLEWKATVDAAAAHVNRCAPGEWPPVALTKGRDPLLMQDVHKPVEWGAWVVARGLRDPKASATWGTLALALEDASGRKPVAKALWTKAQKALARVAPLVVLVTPAAPAANARPQE
jgi:hypothetical protein